MEDKIAMVILGVIVGCISALITVFKLGHNTVTKDDLRHAVKDLRDEISAGFKSLDEKIEKLDTRLYDHVNDYNKHNVSPRVPSHPYDGNVKGDS